MFLYKKASQTVVIYQTDEQSLAERSFGCAQETTVEVSRFLFSSKSIHITTRWEFFDFLTTLIPFSPCLSKYYVGEV